MEEIKQIIRDVPDFPKQGIVFKDITPLLGHPEMFGKVVDHLKGRFDGRKVDHVVGIEARGFIFAAPLAYALGAGCVIVRKPGKLPYKTFQQTYTLEYGTDSIEIHQDAIKPDSNVVLIDDVLATGGTMAAAAELVKVNFNANILEATFIIELEFLKGREKLGGLDLHSLIQY